MNSYINNNEIEIYTYENKIYIYESRLKDA